MITELHLALSDKCKQGDLCLLLRRGRSWGEKPFWTRWTLWKVDNLKMDTLTIQGHQVFPMDKAWSSKECKWEIAEPFIKAVWRNGKLIYWDDVWLWIKRDIEADFEADGILNIRNKGRLK